jgi:hypothetical protein
VPVRWTILQALVALALEIDPEMCRLVAAAGLDLQLLIEGPKWNWLSYWSPTFDSLRSVGLDERLRRLGVELLRRVQSHEWVLILLPDDNQPARPLHDDQLAALTIDSFDIKRARFDDPEKSDVILGDGHYRARVEITERTEPKLGPEVTRVRDALLADLRSGKRSPEELSSDSKTLKDHYVTTRSTYRRARLAALAVFSKG